MDRAAARAGRAARYFFTRNKVGLAASLAAAPFAGPDAVRRPGVFKRIMDRRWAPASAALCVSASLTFYVAQVLEAMTGDPAFQARFSATSQGRVMLAVIEALPWGIGVGLSLLTWGMIVAGAHWRAFLVGRLSGQAWDREERRAFARRHAFWQSSKLIYWSGAWSLVGLLLWLQVHGLEPPDPGPYAGLLVIPCALVLWLRRDRQEAIDLELLGGARVRLLCLLIELALTLLLLGAPLLFLLWWLGG